MELLSLHGIIQSILIVDTIQKPVISKAERNLPVKQGLKILSVPQQIEAELNKIMDKYKEGGGEFLAPYFFRSEEGKEPQRHRGHRGKRKRGWLR